MLEVETRFVRGPHSYDGSGLPFHTDNQARFKESMYLDRADLVILYDEITTYDHALTRPWTITRGYQRTRSDLVPKRMRGRQPARSGRRGRLSRGRRWTAYASSRDRRAPALGTSKFGATGDVWRFVFGPLQRQRRHRQLDAAMRRRSPVLGDKVNSRTASSLEHNAAS